MEFKFKISTWNLCLGLSNKNKYVSQILLENDIDLCCLQEIEVKKDQDENSLSAAKYTLLVENNEYKQHDLGLLSEL